MKGLGAVKLLKLLKKVWIFPIVCGTKETVRQSRVKVREYLIPISQFKKTYKSKVRSLLGKTSSESASKTYRFVAR